MGSRGCHLDELARIPCWLSSFYFGRFLVINSFASTTTAMKHGRGQHHGLGCIMSDCSDYASALTRAQNEKLPARAFMSPRKDSATVENDAFIILSCVG